VSSVVKLRSFVNASILPIAVLVATLARPRLFHRNHFHRNHKVTYPCDALVGRALDDMAAHQTYRAFSQDLVSRER
jgi:hypothetical protein